MTQATGTDRDAKFVSDLWQSLVKKSNTNILTFTVLHSQTDGQSKRITSHPHFLKAYGIIDIKEVDS